MPVKKRFFTRNKEKVGKKSGKAREKQNKIPSGLKEQAIQERDSLKKLPVSLNKQSAAGKFPINYRSITEPFRLFWISIFSTPTLGKETVIAFFLVLFGVSVWQAVGLGTSLMRMQNVLQQRSKLSDDLKLWESITGKYPSYRDAYFQAGVLAYRLGDMQKETVYLGKTLELDPNFVPAQSLERMGK